MFWRLRNPRARCRHTGRPVRTFFLVHRRPSSLCAHTAEGVEGAFWGPSVVPIYILISKVWKFPLVFILSSPWHYQTSLSFANLVGINGIRCILDLSIPSFIFLLLKNVFIYLFLERGKGREEERGRNTDGWDKHRSVAFARALTGAQTRNPGMCPVQAPNWWPSRAIFLLFKFIKYLLSIFSELGIFLGNRKFNVSFF